MSPFSHSTDDAVPRSVGRAFDLLEIVIAGGEINLTTAAAQAGLTPTTALRHLRALEARGYVRRDVEGSFAAGSTVLRLAAAVGDGGPFARLISTAKPLLNQLTQHTGESSYVAIADGDRAVYLATCESKHSIRHVGWVGKSVPIGGTAVGEALAGLPGARTRSGSVETDITAVAQAVCDGATTIAALSIIGPTHRMGKAAIAVATDALRHGVEQLRSDLGLAPVIT